MKSRARMLSLIVLSGCILAGCGTRSRFGMPWRSSHNSTIALADSESLKGTANVNEQPAEEVTTASGLKYVELVKGTGESPKRGQTAVVHYTGWLTDGTKFDSSVDRRSPFSFRVGAGQVIGGWDEGVASMKIGAKRKLIVPPDLGYGARGAGGKIPPNATLVFEVELLDVK
jgi:peptidylprolyl isomerase